MIIEYSARSHTGWVREKNEDNLFINGVTLPDGDRERPFAIDGRASDGRKTICGVAVGKPAAPFIFAVFDGMGGEEDGEVASGIAAQSLSAFASDIASAPVKEIDVTVQSFVDSVHESIVADSGNDVRMGTTLALVVAAGGKLRCFNVGDSRVFVYRRGVFSQVTNDHTLAAEMALNPEDFAAEQAPGFGVARLGKLTRCIGIGDAHTIESYQPTRGKCRVLVCSDGLTDMVDFPDIENVMRGSVRAAGAADELLDMALDNGGRDNITLIVADVKP